MEPAGSCSPAICMNISGEISTGRMLHSLHFCAPLLKSTLSDFCLFFIPFCFNFLTNFFYTFFTNNVISLSTHSTSVYAHDPYSTLRWPPPPPLSPSYHPRMQDSPPCRSVFAASRNVATSQPDTGFLHPCSLRRRAWGVNPSGNGGPGGQDSCIKFSGSFIHVCPLKKPNFSSVWHAPPPFRWLPFEHFGTKMGSLDIDPVCSTFCPSTTSTRSTTNFHSTMFQYSVSGLVMLDAFTSGKDGMLYKFELKVPIEYNGPEERNGFSKILIFWTAFRTSPPVTIFCRRT